MFFKYLTKIPERYRSFFYSLPLFIQWVIGLTWERDEKPLQYARSGMVAGVLYIFLNGFLFFAQKFFLAVLPTLEYNIILGAAIAHGVFTASYLLYSVVVALGALLNLSTPPGIVNRLGLKIDKLLSF